MKNGLRATLKAYLVAVFAYGATLAAPAQAEAPALRQSLSAVAPASAAPAEGATRALRGSLDASADQSGLTDILTPGDIDRYSRIFAVQEQGQWAKADRLIAKLDDRLLMGHVLAQRYLHPTAYRSKYSELRSWLASYADHPQSRRIYALAVKRRPKGAAWPKKPQTVSLRFAKSDRASTLVPKRRTATERRRVARIKRAVKAYTAKERPTQALRYLEDPKTARLLTRLEADDLRAQIAASYFFEHVDDKALKLAGRVAERNRERVPRADWTAGIAAWRTGKPELAAHHFEALATSASAKPGLKAAGAYWAARAHLVAGSPERVTKNLTIAADAPLSFYGLLALRQLGQTPPLNWSAPAPSHSELLTALARPQVKRAIALAQVGRAADADVEMRRAHALAPPQLDEALLKLCADYRMAAAQLHIAEAVPGRPWHAALYPIPAYTPAGGFEVDPAVIYALMRQESRFKPQAKSRAGARGLMQIMPMTAVHVSGDRSLKWKKAKLNDPAFNISLGQDYIEELLGTVSPRGNLFMMAVAYNGGPGNLKRWYREMAVQDDPLLFIESIPVSESRHYVETVLTNMWLYRYRMGEPAPSLDMVAGGDWPIYIPQHRVAGGRDFVPSAQSH